MCSKSSQKGKFDIFGDDKPMNIDEALIRAVADKYGVFSTPSKRKGERGEAYQRRVAANAANRKVVEEALGIKTEPESPAPAKGVDQNDMGIPTSHRIADVPAPKVLKPHGKYSVAEIYAKFKELAKQTKMYEGNPEILDMAERVFTLADTLGITIDVGNMRLLPIDKYKINRNSPATWFPTINHLGIAVGKLTGGSDKYYCASLLHETIHSVTSYALKRYETGELKDQRLQKACAEVEDVFHECERRGLVKSELVDYEDTSSQEWYAMTNVHEFLAELSNPAFVARLERERLWERVVNGVLQIFGIEKPDGAATDAYKRAFAAMDKMLRGFSYDEFNAHLLPEIAKVNPTERIEIDSMPIARTKPAPKRTRKCYKLMRLVNDKLYPLFIDNATPIELGRWYDADSPDFGPLQKLKADAYQSGKVMYGVYLLDNTSGKALSLADFANSHPDIAKSGAKHPSVEAVNWATRNGCRWVQVRDNGRTQRRYGGGTRSYYNYGVKRGADGRSSIETYAMRPGWHAATLPTMRQIGLGGNNSDVKMRDAQYVWVEGEIAADVDYNAEAQRNPDKDIPDRMPTDGFYMKATNADKSASQEGLVGWYVSGAFKANRIIGDREAREIIDRDNAANPDRKAVEYDWPRVGGDFEPATSKIVIQPDEKLIEAIKYLYENGGKTASQKYAMTYFDVAPTSDILRKCGLTGGKFTIRFGTISRHYKKDDAHFLPIEVWEQLPTALQDPLLVSKFYTDENKQKQKGFRIYTALQLNDGSYVVVGAEVKNAGKNIEINSVSTIFGRNVVSNERENIVYASQKMTPAQSSLLGRNILGQYPPVQRSSADKGTSISETNKKNNSSNNVIASNPIAEALKPAEHGGAVSRRRQREVIDSKEMAVQGALNAAAGAGYQAQNRRGFKYGSTWSEYFVDNANPLARLIRNQAWSRG